MSAIDFDLNLIEGVAFDVDGVLSCSTIPIGADGEPMRMVNIKDGYAIQYALKTGLKLAIITGGTTISVHERFINLGMEDVYMGAMHKLPVLKEWADRHSLQLDRIAYVGDDIPDIPVLKAVGLSCCPSDAATDVRCICRYISKVAGGYGVGRDLLEQILRAKGLWMNDEQAFGW